MILNLTQHPASPEQIDAGVRDLPTFERDALKALLTFDEIPTRAEILARASDLADLACINGLGGDEGDSPWPDQVMIGGALWLMAPLESALMARGIEPVYAFSMRDTLEQIQADGTVRKIAVFKHTGFISAGKD